MVSNSFTDSLHSSIAYVSLVKNVVVFLLVAKNVRVHLAKESGNPSSGLPLKSPGEYITAAVFCSKHG